MVIFVIEIIFTEIPKIKLIMNHKNITAVDVIHWYEICWQLENRHFTIQVILNFEGIFTSGYTRELVKTIQSVPIYHIPDP